MLANIPHRILELRFPRLGRVAMTRDQGDAGMFGVSAFSSHLEAVITRADGRIEYRDLGSGLTTQSLALALANQSVSAANAATLASAFSMASGTGATAAAAYDYQLQTLSTSTTEAGGVTSGSTLTIGVSADNATLLYSAVLHYNATVAVTEWGLFAGTGKVGSQYNTATDTFAATTATPGTSPAWTVNAFAGLYVVQVASATSVLGLITSNSATAVTISPGWVNQTAGGGAGSTPSSNTAMNIYPLMADHKVFAALNVNSGDSITYNYTLTLQSGN